MALRLSEGLGRTSRQRRRAAEFDQLKWLAAEEPAAVLREAETCVERQRRVLMILKATLLVLPYEEVQPFAAEALNSFLRLVKKLNEAPATPDEA